MYIYIYIYMYVCMYVQINDVCSIELLEIEMSYQLAVCKIND